MTDSQLENALEGQPPAKRARTMKSDNVDSSIGGPANSTSAVSDKAKAKADAKKVDALLKKFWSR